MMFELITKETSNGISTMQACMPEFSSHTKGIKVQVSINENKNRFNLKRFLKCKICLINHSTFSIICLSILSTLVGQQTR
jgi:hypothetical protein